MQQINLYQPLFRKQEKIFSTRTMLEGAVLVLIGILAFYSYALWQTYNLEQQVAAAKTRRDQAAKQEQQLNAMYPEQQKDQVLAQRVTQLYNAIALRRQVIAHLADRNEGNTAGYAGQLEGLARQRFTDTWLTHIDISHGGNSLVLSGSTLQPDQVPQFIQRLSQEPVFAGLEFHSFMMNRPKDEKSQQIDFTLMTDRPKKK